MAHRGIEATRYVTPLREGGSLPALVEASDDGLYVLKFRGAGQGPKALIAEVIAGELARALGFAVPELALVELDESLGRAEPDPEIQDLLAASVGLNLGVDFLHCVAHTPQAWRVRPSPSSLDRLSPSLRRRIKQRDGGRCVRCGSTENLRVHHRRQVAHGGKHSDSNLETLCDSCHRCEHTSSGRRTQ